MVVFKKKGRVMTGRIFQMKTLKYLRRDMRLGTVNRAYVFLIPLVFSLLMSLQFSSIINVFNANNNSQFGMTIMDYYVFAMKGLDYYTLDPFDLYPLPLYWFTFQMGISYFIAYYPEKDYSENGVNILVSGKSRASWWLSKVFWCILSVLVYYLVAFVSCAVFALIQGAGLSLGVTKEFEVAYFGYNMTYVSYSDLIVIAVIVPFSITAAICLVQLLMSFVLSPVTSFAVTCGMYVLSAYYTAWFFPGSFTIWLRSSYFDERGLDSVSGLVIAAFMAVTAVGFGIMNFEKKDII